MSSASAVRELDIAVLAGGLGTRVAGVLGDLPKILAPVAGLPFLDHLLGWLSRQGADRVVLCLGYRAAAVEAYLEKRRFQWLELVSVVEPRPLGTAGALGFALVHLRSDPVMVVNGDTFVDADLSAFLASHRHAGAAVSMLCAQVQDPGRYGRIDIDRSGRVMRFHEKDSRAMGPSWINAGIYLFNQPVLERIAKPGVRSLERDLLETMPPGSIHAFQTSGRFLDIGTPESLALASQMLPADGIPGRGVQSHDH